MFLCFSRNFCRVIRNEFYLFLRAKWGALTKEVWSVLVGILICADQHQAKTKNENNNNTMNNHTTLVNRRTHAPRRVSHRFWWLRDRRSLSSQRFSHWWSHSPWYSQWHSFAVCFWFSVWLSCSYTLWWSNLMVAFKLLVACNLVVAFNLMEWMKNCAISHQLGGWCIEGNEWFVDPTP